ncbi:MAG: cytochrome c [SAR324 cluster bacterium]|nr:cytochrome c [SAR324 cluster bacterium]
MRKSSPLVYKTVLMFMLLCVPLITSAQSTEDAQTRNVTLQKTNLNNLIRYRGMVMQIKGMHTLTLKYLIRKRINARPQIIAHAESLQLMTDDLLRLFMVKSISPKSRAKESIWDAEGRLSPEFEELAKVMKTEALKLIETVKFKSQREILQQLKLFEERGCKECHSQFRGEGTPDPIPSYEDELQLEP